MTKSRFKRIFSILLSISIAAAGVCLIAACVGIYRSGQPFSREAVAKAFSPISFTVYLCLGLTVLGFLLDAFLPEKAGKLSASRQNFLVLRRLRAKADLSRCDAALLASIEAERKRRLVFSGLRTILLALTGAVFLGYVFSGDRFLLPDINSSMLQAMAVLLPCLAVTFGWAVFAAWQNAASIQREISLLKQVPAAEKPAAKKNSARNLTFLRCAILLIGIFLVAYGFNIGGTADVLTKAINICTECVGLG